MMTPDRTTIPLKTSQAANSTDKKFAVRYLNEALCFISSLVVPDGFRFLNRQLHLRRRELRMANNAQELNDLKFPTANRHSKETFIPQNGISEILKGNRTKPADTVMSFS